MKDLALQIRFIDCVEVDDAERPDASRRKVEQCWTAQAPRSDHQHAGVLQPLLAINPASGNDQMTAVAAYLVDGQLIDGRYQRRQGHGSPPVQGRGRSK